MTDDTIWKLDVQPGNSQATFKAYENSLNTIKGRINQVVSAGENFSKLASFQTKAAEAGKRLEVAQASAALAAKKAADAANNGKVSAEQLAVMQTRAGLAAQKVHSAENALAGAMDKATKESDRLASAMQENSAKSNVFARGLDSAKASLGNLASFAKGAAVVGITAIGAAFVAVGGALASTVKPAVDFQATMLKINALAGVSKEDIGAASDAILKMSSQVGKGPQDLAEGLYYIASAGFDAKTSMLILEGSAKAAAVGMTDTQTVANAVTAALKAFPGLAVADAMDIMSKTVATGKTEWADYAGVVGEVSLAASQSKVRFVEANAAFSILTNTMKASEAATALKGLLQTSSHVSDLAHRARGLGLAFDENTYKTQTFLGRLQYLDTVTKGNSESMKTLLGTDEAMAAIGGILTDNAKDYSKALDGIAESTGTANEQFKTTSASTQAAWDRAKASVQALQLKIGTALLPVITLFADKIAPLVASIADWIEKNHIIEKSIDAVSSVIKTISDFITPLAPKFLDIAKNFSKVGEAFQNPAFQKLAADIGDDLKTGLTWLINALASPQFGAFMKTVGEGLAAAIQFVIPLVKDIAKNVMQFAMDVSTRVQPLIEDFMAFWNENWPKTANILAGVWNMIKGTVQVAWSIVSGIIKIGLDLLNGDWEKAWNDFLEMCKGVWEGLKTYVQGAIMGLVGLFRPLLEGLAQIPGPAGDMARKVLDSFDVMKNGTLDKATQMKVNMLDQTEQMHVGSVDKLEKMKNDLIQKIHDTTDPVKRKALEMQLGVTEQMQKMHKEAAIGASNMKKDVTGSAKGMSNEMVGHSIIPDMVNSVIAWFGRMAGGAMGAIASLPSRLAGFWNMLVANATSAGANIVNGIAAGIRGAIGAVTGAMSWVASQIAAHLPHSPAKIGPLRDLHYQGSQITEQVASGMLASMPKLNAAIGRITAPVTANLAITPGPTPSFAASSGTFGGGSNDSQAIALLARILAVLERQGKIQPGVTMNANVAAGSIDEQRILQAMQSIGGRQIEMMQRGGG